MSVDLYREFYAALSAVPGNDDEPIGRWLARRGLTANRRDLVGGVGVMRAVLTDSTGTFEPNSDGERVIVCPVWDGRACEPDCVQLHLSEFVDMIAWRPEAPERLYRRLDVGAVLGSYGVTLAASVGYPLRLFRAAESFIRYGGELHGATCAAVLLDPAHAWRLLSSVPQLITDDIEHGEELQRLLTGQRPRLPRLTVQIENAA